MSQRPTARKLQDRDHVRLRKGMYIPSIDYSVYEAIDNAVDEAAAGFGTDIWLTIYPDRTTTVLDNGRGLPIEPAIDEPDMSVAEMVLSNLKAGTKFGLEDSEQAKTGGLNGVGISAINFLSEYLEAIIYKDGKKYGLRFEEGIVTEKLFELGDIEEGEPESGTFVALKPDEEIWKDDEDYNLAAINNRMKQLTYLNPGLSIHVNIDYNGVKIEETHYNPDGLVAYLKDISGKSEMITDIYEETVAIDGTDVSLAFAYTEKYDEKLYSYTNNVFNSLGGSHLAGFKDGISKSILNYYDERFENKGKLSLNNEDVREGLIGIISIKIKDPNFDGQGKAKLTMPKVKKTVRTVTEEYLSDILDKNPEVAKLLIAKAQDAARAREAARKAKETARKTKSVGDGKAEKLADCASNVPEEIEIFLVEGDSAAGTAKEGRDRNIQAILPVFGKINNVEKIKLDKALDSVKIREIFKALKCGAGDEFDLEKLRYHKIIIMADADVDGSHIQCLYITLFFKFLRPIIEEGHLYLACPPLFAIKKGKDVTYAYSDEERDQILEQLGDGCTVSRFKGLGEMDSEQLWETTMDPENRTLIQVDIDDALLAEQIINTCMGEDVVPRREFIMENIAAIEIVE